MLCAAGSRSFDSSVRMSLRTLASFAMLSALAATPSTNPHRSGLAAQEPVPRQVRIPQDRLETMTRAPAARVEVPVFDTTGLDRRVQVDEADGLVLQRGQFALLRTGDASTATTRQAQPGEGVPSEATGDWQVLPYRYVTPDATGTGVWVLRPIYKVASRLRWDPASDAFAGSFFLAVEDSLRLDESRPLPAPVRFQLISEADSVAPEPVAIAHTNFPLERVRVVARGVSDSLRVHVVPEFDVRGLDVWIPVAPTLVIEAPDAIQGWGIQQARVVVRVIGASTVDDAAAGLTTTAGALDTLEVPIGRTGAGNAWLRSEGLSEASLVAAAPGFGEARAVIDFTFPWVFLLAALLGGVFGGLAAAAAERKGRRKARWGEFALKGVLAGVLAALAWYALGVNLLQLDVGVPRFNELAVFTLAALADYFGIPRTLPQPASG